MRKYHALAVVMLCALFTNVLASPEWLLAQRQADGSIATDADVATSFQSTAEGVRSLRLLGHAASVDASQANLAAQPYHGTEYLSRKIFAAAEASVSVDALMTELLARQNVDGGFGEQVGYQSTAVDTAFAVEALAATSYQNHAAANNALSYLLQTQRSVRERLAGWPAQAPGRHQTEVNLRPLHELMQQLDVRISAIKSAAVGGVLESDLQPERLGWSNYWSEATARWLGFPDPDLDRELLQRSKRTSSGAWLVRTTHEPLDLTRAEHVRCVAALYERFPRLWIRFHRSE